MEHKKMKLNLKSKMGNMTDYHCDLTKTLDELAGIEPNSRWKHYIMLDNYTKIGNSLSIRVPGGTVGSILYDKDMIIIDIDIDTTYVVKTYVDNVNKIVKDMYIGVQLEI